MGLIYNSETELSEIKVKPDDEAVIVYLHEHLEYYEYEITLTKEEALKMANSIINHYKKQS